MEEKHYWTTNKGDEIDISKMNTSHIKNAIRCLERRLAGVWVEGREWLRQCKECLWLEEELERRR